MLKVDMFGGSYRENIRALEAVLGCLVADVAVRSVTLRDRANRNFPLGFIAFEANCVSAAFFGVLGGGAKSFDFDKNALALTQAFFGEHWDAPDRHPIASFCKEVGLDLHVDLT